MANYYDFVLVLIPFLFAGTAGALTVVGLGVTSAVPVGALSVFPVVGHAMFVRGPGQDPRPEADSSPQSSHAARQSGLQSAD